MNASAFPRLLRACSAPAAGLVLLALLAPAVAFAQNALTGTVTNTATGRALEGARVTIAGTARETLTDAQGISASMTWPPAVLLWPSLTPASTRQRCR